MKVFRVIFALGLLLIVCFSVEAQKSCSKYSKDADGSFRRGEYYTAIMQYKKAYSRERNNTAKACIIFQTAECYRYINDTKQAEIWYKKAVRVKYPDPVAILYLAQSKKSNDKYDEALIEYKNYQDRVPQDARASDGIKSCELAVEWIDNPGRFEVFNVLAINTVDADFSPAYSKRGFKQIMFTSSREGATGLEKDGTTGQNFTDLWEAKIDRKGKWNTPSLLNEAVNSSDNEGAAVLDAKFRMMYMTRCPIIQDKEVNCKILIAKKKGSNWDNPEEIPLVPDTITAGHPSISKDGLKLYFASNLAGGYGGKDIWMVSKAGKRDDWSEPINLGPDINTSGDEMFPFLHEDGSLYFSSSGHIGMGGLDIFHALYKGNSWGDVSNMRYPINSAGDDFSIIFEGSNNRGYFTSNRKGGKGGDDIYQFMSPQLTFTLQGVVIDADTREILVGATVVMVGDDGTSEEQLTDEVGSYFFQLKANTNYDITASMPKYLSDNGKETTVGLEKSTDLVHDFELRTTKKIINLPNVFYDLDKWDLRPESKEALDGLIKTLTDNPNIVIKIMSHTDSRADHTHNDGLSQKRAQSVVDYLIDQGIEIDRLEAKGYGKHKPLITDRAIGKLRTEEEKEAAHQSNRRTEFSIERTDYIPMNKRGNMEEKPDGEQLLEEGKTEDPGGK
ncbi:MAG: OmpA family protein [Flavobacteriales bacterium]|nr:OmpA family protein [Flavobacteriales bacterium]